MIFSEDQKGRLFYFNSESKKSSWEHPCDNLFRSIVEKERIKNSATTISMSGLTSLANLHFVDEEMSISNNEKTDDKKKLKSEEPLKEVNEHLNDIKNRGKQNKETQKKDKITDQSDEEVESVEFELDIEAAFQEFSIGNDDDDDKDELVTIDVTEGGSSDTKQLNEIHTIKLSETIKNAESISENDILHNKNDNDIPNNKLENNNDLTEPKPEMKMQMSLSSLRLAPLNTDEKVIREKRKNNQVLDELALGLGEEDPFADFASDDVNVNVLFGTDNAAGSKVSKHNANGNASQSYLGIKHHTPEPLETVEERSEREEIGEGNHESESSRDDHEEADGQNCGEEDDDDDDDDDDDEEQDDGGENIVLLEAKFDEITNNLTEKIETLRNEIKDELKKQKNSVNNKIKEQMTELDQRMRINEKDLKQVKSEMGELKPNQLYKINNNQQFGNYELEKKFEKIKREIQSVKSELQEETIRINEKLEIDLTRDLKSKINLKFDELEEKFVDLKQENQSEIKYIKNELESVIVDNRKAIQQSNELKDDLSQVLLGIDKQKKDQHNQLERISLKFDEEIEKFQNQMKRLLSLMDSQENKIKDLETNFSREITNLSLKGDASNQVHFKINHLSSDFEKFKQQVNDILQFIDENKKQIEIIQKNVNNKTNYNNDQHILVDNSADNLGVRIGHIEENVNRIYDTVNQIKPMIIDNHLYDEKGNNYKQDVSDKAKILQFGHTEKDLSSDASTHSSDSLLSKESNVPKTTHKKRKNRKTHSKYQFSDSAFTSCHRCCHKSDNYPLRNYQLAKLPLINNAPWESQNKSQYKNIKSSSNSLLNLIKKTTQKLKEEAMELESLGNYNFTSDIGNSVSIKEESDGDEEIIKKLKLVRIDVDEKLKKLTHTLNQQKYVTEV